MERKKPKIGLLGIMQELYDDMLPGITERQSGYAHEIADHLGDAANVVFTGPARNRHDIEVAVREFNNNDFDGIMMVLLTYSPGLRLVRAFRENHLPVLLANVQPVPVVTKEWNMGDLTYNQGIHGAQDNANALIRAGVKFSVVSEDWRSDSFKSFFSDWARTAQTISRLKKMKVAAFGRMSGMGDITTDASAFMRKIGPQIVLENTGKIHSLFEKTDDSEIDEVMEKNRKNFLVDPKLGTETHRYAARFEVALKKFLETNGYEAFSVYFQEIADDGRFTQLPMMAASDLLAEGYGYGAEGDVCAATLVAAGHTLIGDAHFAEMYAMDFEKDAVLISHMGEGNWKVARKDRPIRLVDRELGIGGLGNPPTVVFSAQPGTGTIASLVSLENERFRLVVSKGEILDTEEFPTIEMPYFFFKPETGVRKCIDGWLNQGGTHHQCFNLGDQRKKWKLFCEMLGIEYVEV